MRPTAATGILGLVFVLAFVAPPWFHGPAGSLDEEAPASEAAAFLRDYRAWQDAQWVAHVVAAFLLVGFAAGLWGLARPTGAAAFVFVTGTATMLAHTFLSMGLVAFSIVAAAGEFAVSDEVVKGAYFVGWSTWDHAAYGFALMFAGFALATRGTNVLPRWLRVGAWALPALVAVSLAVTLAVGGAAGLQARFLVLLLSALWTLLASLALLTRGRNAAAADPNREPSG